MNITLNGIKITQDSKNLAFEKNNNVDEIVVTVDTDESWSYKLDVKYPDKFNIGKDTLYNIIDLNRNGNICSAILDSKMLPFNGKYTMQLRGINGDKVYHSDTFEAWVKYSIEPGSTYDPVPSEFYQIENKLDDKVNEAKQYAENAEIASTRMPKISSDNTWLIWDVGIGDYVDTGVAASGGGSGEVSSVNGKVGAVELTAGDVGAATVNDVYQLKSDLADLAPAGAAVGQLFRVAAISEDGKYTMEPVDMPNGGVTEAVHINLDNYIEDFFGTIGTNIHLGNTEFTIPVSNSEELWSMIISAGGNVWLDFFTEEGTGTYSAKVSGMAKNLDGLINWVDVKVSAHTAQGWIAAYIGLFNNVALVKVKDKPGTSS